MRALVSEGFLPGLAEADGFRIMDGLLNALLFFLFVFGRLRIAQRALSGRPVTQRNSIPWFSLTLMHLAEKIQSSGKRDRSLRAIWNDLDFLRCV